MTTTGPRMKPIRTKLAAAARALLTAAISAVSLRVTFPGSRPVISLATGTTHYDGGPPVSALAPWQVGSNTKACGTMLKRGSTRFGRLGIVLDGA